jgi:hypothetical protein
MKNILILFFIIVISLTFVSCERDATVELPDTEPKPVLVCFISPQDSMIRVTLTNSRPIYSSQKSNFPYIIKNAEVKISSNGTSATIPFISDSLGYQLATNFFALKEGEKYFLDVTIPDGRKLSASTQVPVKKPNEVKYKLTRTVNDSNEYFVDLKYNVEISWEDIIGEKNTYRTIIYSLNTTKNSTDTSTFLISEEYKSDDLGDGLTIKTNTEIFAGYSTDSVSGNVPVQVGTLIYLVNGNDDYIKYHKDLSRFQEMNPFSEPTINFSNIKGGIGCFGAYLMDKKRL